MPKKKIEYVEVEKIVEVEKESAWSLFGIIMAFILGAVVLGLFVQTLLDGYDAIAQTVRRVRVLQEQHEMQNRAIDNIDTKLSKLTAHNICGPNGVLRSDSFGVYECVQKPAPAKPKERDDKTCATVNGDKYCVFTRPDGSNYYTLNGKNFPISDFMGGPQGPSGHDDFIRIH